MKYNLLALLIAAAMTTTFLSGCSPKPLTATEFTPEQKKALEQKKEQQAQDEANRYGRPR